MIFNFSFKKIAFNNNQTNEQRKIDRMNMVDLTRKMQKRTVQYNPNDIKTYQKTTI